MPSIRQPVSVVLTEPQLAWLDAQTKDGTLSRSAVIRLALQELMERDTQQQRRRRPALAAR